MGTRSPRLRPPDGAAAASRPAVFGLRARVLGFLALFSGLTVFWQALADTPALEAWIQGVVVPAAAAWLNLVAALLDVGTVAADGPRLVGTQAVLNVLPGCEGSDAMALVAAAVLVAPRPAMQRMLGLLLVLSLVFVLNQARLAGLLWALAVDRAVFDQLHTVWLPLALVLASATVFWAWLVASAPSTQRSAAA